MGTIKDVRTGLWQAVTEAMVNSDLDAARRRLDVLRANIRGEEKAWSELTAFEKKLDKAYREQMSGITRGERYKDMNPIVAGFAKKSDIDTVKLWFMRESYYFWGRLIGEHKLMSEAS